MLQILCIDLQILYIAVYEGIVKIRIYTFPNPVKYEHT